MHRGVHALLALLAPSHRVHARQMMQLERADVQERGSLTEEWHGAPPPFSVVGAVGVLGKRAERPAPRLRPIRIASGDRS